MYKKSFFFIEKSHKGTEKNRCPLFLRSLCDKISKMVCLGGKSKWRERI